MTNDEKKFWKWLSQRRKVMGLLWKQVEDEANVSKTTLNRVRNGVSIHLHSRDRIAEAFGFASWQDLSNAYRSGVAPDERLPRRAKDAGMTIAPARLADQLVRLCQADATKYREQMFQHLTPKAVAEIAEIFTGRALRSAKGIG